MLKITEAQVTALRDVLVEAFCDRVLQFARTDLTECVEHMTHAGLRDRILEDHAAARALGILDPQAMWAFLSLSLMGGEERFYLDPPSREHLLRDGDPERQVFHMLADVQRDAERRMAEEAERGVS